MLLLSQLTITQEEIRDGSQLYKMAQLVRGGDFFDKNTLESYDTEKAFLMEIAEFPDGRHFLHNGHHRCIAISYGGRDYLREDEYYIKKWKYEDYDSINFDVGYYTPFDIRTETRISDLSKYKEFIKGMIHEYGEEFTLDVIKHCKVLYAKKRTYSTINELRIVYDVS